LKKGYPILTILVHVFKTQLAIKWPFSFPPHFSAFALPWKNRTDKICNKINKTTKNCIKFYFSGYAATNSQSITRFDCCAAARLSNRPNIQEYRWIQKGTGEVWIGLEQNVINEWRKCLWAEPMVVGQHFKHCCRQL